MHCSGRFVSGQSTVDHVHIFVDVLIAHVLPTRFFSDRKKNVFQCNGVKQWIGRGFTTWILPPNFQIVADVTPNQVSSLEHCDGSTLAWGTPLRPMQHAGTASHLHLLRKHQQYQCPAPRTFVRRSAAPAPRTFLRRPADPATVLSGRSSMKT
jgi:hypothetical protein